MASNPEYCPTCQYGLEKTINPEQQQVVDSVLLIYRVIDWVCGNPECGRTGWFIDEIQRIPQGEQD